MQQQLMKSQINEIIGYYSTVCNSHLYGTLYCLTIIKILRYIQNVKSSLYAARQKQDYESLL